MTPIELDPLQQKVMYVTALLFKILTKDRRKPFMPWSVAAEHAARWAMDADDDVYRNLFNSDPHAVLHFIVTHRADIRTVCPQLYGYYIEWSTRQVDGSGGGGIRLANAASLPATGRFLKTVQAGVARAHNRNIHTAQLRGTSQQLTRLPAPRV